MKKIVSLIVFVTLTLGMPIHLLADGEITSTQASKEKSEEINIDYNMEETYTVIFPASVTFTDTEKTVERPLSVSNVYIHEGSSLSVKVSSLNDFKMKNGDGYIEYELRVNYNPAIKENNTDILRVDAGEHTGLAILEFVTDLNKKYASYAGNYTDTLTFTVSVE